MTKYIILWLFKSSRYFPSFIRILNLFFLAIRQMNINMCFIVFLFNSFPPIVLFYITLIWVTRCQCQWYVKGFGTYQHCHSILLHSEVRDAQHPGFISMSRCFICSFHNEAISPSALSRSFTSTLAVPSCLACLAQNTHGVTTKKTKKISAYAQLHNDITVRGSYCVESNWLLYSSSLHDCAVLSAAENLRSTSKRHHFDDP